MVKESNPEGSRGWSQIKHLLQNNPWSGKSTHRSLSDDLSQLPSPDLSCPAQERQELLVWVFFSLFQTTFKVDAEEWARSEGDEKQRALTA